MRQQLIHFTRPLRRQTSQHVVQIAECIGEEKVGVRFAPLLSSTYDECTYLGMVEDDPHTTYIEAIKVLEDVGIAYLSIADGGLG